MVSEFFCGSCVSWLDYSHPKYLGVSALVAGSLSVLPLVWRRFVLGDLDCTKVLPGSWDFSEFLGRTASRLQATSQEVCFLPFVVLVSRRILLCQAASLLSGGLLSVAVFSSCYARRRGNNSGNIIILFAVFFGFIITNLPCHVVTLQSAVRV